MADLEQRIAVLEQQMAAVARAAEEERKQTFLQRLPRLLVTHWALITFAIALLTATYVKFAFDVDYFEEYRNTSAKKRISEHYRALGDRLLYADDDAAEDAFKKAVEINPHNIRAQYGLAKASVFKPLPGETYPDPRVHAIRLQSLLEQFKGRGSAFASPAELAYLSGMERLHNNQFAQALPHFLEAIRLDPNFAPPHEHVGVIHHKNGNTDAALASYQRAVELNPRLANAVNNLGCAYLQKLDFEKSVTYLAQAWDLSPDVIIRYDLGEAYRYDGQFENAAYAHEVALEALTEKDLTGREKFIRGGWFWSYLPASRDAKQEEEPKSYEVNSLPQKEAVVRAALAIDYALLGRIAEAEKQLARAYEIDGRPELRDFLHNRMTSIGGFVEGNVPETGTAWLMRKAAAIEEESAG